MSNLRWQDLMGSASFDKVADDESSPLNFEQLASIAETEHKEAEDDSAQYSEMFAPAKTSAFTDYLKPKTADEFDSVANDDEDILTEACMTASKKGHRKTADAAAPGAAYDLKIGDAAIAQVPGATFEGVVIAIEGDKITLEREVNGKTYTRAFAKGNVKPAAAVAEHKQQRQQEDEAERAETERAEQDAASQEQQERIKRLTQSEATGTYDQLAGYLGSAGYKLKLDVSDEQLETFANKYQELTGEELNATSRPKSPEHANKGGWTVEFADTPEVRQYLPWPIDVEKSGLAPRSGEGNERAVTNGKTIKVRYNRPVWELIARGLRYSPKDEAQEVRVSSSKKARLEKGSSDYIVVKMAARVLLANNNPKEVKEAHGFLANRGLVWSAATKKVVVASKTGADKIAQQPMPQKGSPEWHELKIAIQSFQMNPAMLGVMGGPNLEEAGRTLARYGLVWDEAKNKPVKGIFKESEDMTQEHPGAVCGECGRTVTNGEYSKGESDCCKAEVKAEEEFV